MYWNRFFRYNFDAHTLRSFHENMFPTYFGEVYSYDAHCTLCFSCRKAQGKHHISCVFLRHRFSGWVLYFPQDGATSISFDAQHSEFCCVDRWLSFLHSVTFSDLCFCSHFWYTLVDLSPMLLGSISLFLCFSCIYSWLSAIWVYCPLFPSIR